MERWITRLMENCQYMSTSFKEPPPPPIQGELRSRTLYEISVELSEIEFALADFVEADSDVIAAAVDAYLEDSRELREKADRYCMLIRELESRAGARKDEAKRMLALAESDSKSALLLRNRLHEFMMRHQIQKMDSLHFKLSRQPNGGVQAVAVGIDASELPDEYRLIQYSPNNAALREDLLAGKTIDGVTLKERGESLRIR